MSDSDIFFEEQMEDDELKAEFDALFLKYELVRELIKERTAYCI